MEPRNLFEYLIAEIFWKECELCGEKDKSVTAKRGLCRKCYEEKELAKAEIIAHANRNRRSRRRYVYDD